MSNNRAIEKLKKKVKHNPDNVKLRFKLINLLQENGYIDEALDGIIESLQHACQFMVIIF